MTKTLQYISIGGAAWSASVFVLGLWISNVISKEMHQAKKELRADNTEVLKHTIEEMRKENIQMQSFQVLLEYMEDSRVEDQDAMAKFFQHIRKQNKKFEELIKYKESKFDTVLFEDHNGKTWWMIRGDHFGQPIYKQIPFKE